MPTKTEIRTLIRKEKSLYTPSQLNALSCIACEGIRNETSWQEAQTVLLYYPLPDEVDVRQLLEESFADGKTVLLPAVVGLELELRVYNGSHSLSKGDLEILEPVGNVFSSDLYSDIDVVLVPGMAFDENGHRLGRGKGYYDRLLPFLRNAYLLGVAFPFQFLTNIPVEEHDVRMDRVIGYSKISG